MNEARTVAKTMMAQSAKTELKGRIRKIHLEASLVDMACDLCMEQVPIELAFQQIQDKAMEKMIPLLDTRILDQADIMQSCLEMVAEESERVAGVAARFAALVFQIGKLLLERFDLFFLRIDFRTLLIDIGAVVLFDESLLRVVVILHLVGVQFALQDV